MKDSYQHKLNIDNIHNSTGILPRNLILPDPGKGGLENIAAASKEVDL